MQLFSNWNATLGRARRDPGKLFKRTARTTRSAPWQTTANSARPSSTRGVHVSGPVISTTVLTQAHSHAALQGTTERNSSVLPLAGRPSVGAPRAVRRHLGRGRRRCVSVLVNLFLNTLHILFRHGFQPGSARVLSPSIPDSGCVHLDLPRVRAAPPRPRGVFMCPILCT